MVDPSISRNEEIAMCLTCGCMDAHKEMGENNIRYEDVKAAADENGNSMAETIDIMERTIAKDRGEHSQEYASQS
jgi:hypothetical protein